MLGPLGTQQLIEHLYRGDVTANTEVCPLGTEQYIRLAELDAFRLHIAKAEAKLRVEAVAKQEGIKKASRRRVRWISIGVAGLVVSVGAVFGAYRLAINPPWATRDPLADLDFGIEAPQIQVAKAGGTEELLDYPLDNGPMKNGPGRHARPVGPPLPMQTSKIARGPDGMEMVQFDQAAINQVIVAKQPTLKTCFIEEAHRNPSFAAKIPIEFVVGNDGHISKMWVDHPSYKRGPLADCLLKELQKWPFRPYQGQQAVVGLSFRIGKSS